VITKSVGSFEPFFLPLPHGNLFKQVKLIEFKAVFWNVGLFGAKKKERPPSRSLQLRANGAHRTKTSRFDPTWQENQQ